MSLLSFLACRDVQALRKEFKKNSGAAAAFIQNAWRRRALRRGVGKRKAVAQKRIDPSDGQAYTLQDFVECYGGSLVQPPAEWQTAQVVMPPQKAQLLPGMIEVNVPPGGLGMTLRRGAGKKGVIVSGFAPVDGAKGAVETHGGVRPGMYLCQVDGLDVSEGRFKDVLGILKKKAQVAKTLTFIAATKEQTVLLAVEVGGDASRVCAAVLRTYLLCSGVGGRWSVAALSHESAVVLGMS